MIDQISPHRDVFDPASLAPTLEDRIHGVLIVGRLLAERGLHDVGEHGVQTGSLRREVLQPVAAYERPEKIRVGGAARLVAGTEAAYQLPHTFIADLHALRPVGDQADRFQPCGRRRDASGVDARIAPI